MLVTPTQASISVTSTITDNNIYVVYNLQNINQTIYDEIKANQQFNISTIPTAIIKNLENQGLTQVKWWLPLQPDIFNDTTKSIHVSFYLEGSDIIDSETNRTTMKRTYQLNTEWRKLQLDLTNTFSINFTQHFAEPVENWQKPNPTTYHFEVHETGFFDTLSFNLALPTTATNVQAQGDTITYEVQPYFEDVFLNSPFLILAVLIVIIIIALIYRRIR
jgi:hypothetical protein